MTRGVGTHPFPFFVVLVRPCFTYALFLCHRQGGGGGSGWCWNKISSVSPSLDDARFGAKEGPVRVGFAKYVDSPQIFPVDMLIRRSSWLALCVVISASSLIWFVLWHGWFLQPSRLVVNDCKPELHGMMTQSIFLQHLLYLVTSGEWLLWSSKTGFARVFVGVHFIYYRFNAIFKLQRAAYNRL